MTFDDYKVYVRSLSAESAKAVDEIEALSAVIGSLIEKRSELGLSQRELAEKCGVPQSSIARIESFKTSPRLSTLITICEQLGLKITLTPVEESA